MTNTVLWFKTILKSSEPAAKEKSKSSFRKMENEDGAVRLDAERTFEHAHTRATLEVFDRWICL